MSATKTPNNQAVPGAFIRKNYSIALDNSYPNPAGYVFTPEDFGLKAIREISAPSAATLAAGKNNAVIIPTYSGDFITSFALHLVVASTGLEVANAVDVSTSTYSLTVEGF